MKLLVTYSSKTGNTEKLAKGIYNHLQIEGAEIKKISEVDNINDYDTVLVGYWVDKGGPNEEARKFMEALEGKRVGIFATLGAYPDSQHAWDSLVAGENVVKEKNQVIGKGITQGSISEKMINFFKTLPADNPHAITPEKLKRYEIAAKHPNEADIVSIATMLKERL